MKTLDHVSLKGLNSFGVEASAGRVITIEAASELPALAEFDPARDLVLGGGSNILFETDVPGTVFLNRIMGKHVIRPGNDHVLVEAGAGENWHQLVLWTIELGLSGLENLSLIPGLAGAAPVQNIGAYGVELSSVLESVSAWDWEKSTQVSLDKDDCQLAYRDSRFKSREPGRYLITSIRMLLNRQFTPRIRYGDLAAELLRTGAEQPGPAQVSDAVIRIRRRKLPDPAVAGNAGSFFKNPLIEKTRAQTLQVRYPGLPCWSADAGMLKLSAAWMIENCGLKGCRVRDAMVSTQHSLVLVNSGAATGHDLADLARIVRKRVFEEYGIWLEQEPVSVRF